MNLSNKTKELPTRMRLIAEALQSYIEGYDRKASEVSNKELENAFWIQVQAWSPIRDQVSIGTDFVGTDIHYSFTKWLSINKYAKITNLGTRTVAGMVECKELNSKITKTGAVLVEMRIGVSREEYRKIFGGDGR